jgi:hypothetical protein
MEAEVRAARDDAFQYLQKLKDMLDKKSKKKFTGLTNEDREALNISSAIMVFELLEKWIELAARVNPEGARHIYEMIYALMVDLFSAGAAFMQADFAERDFLEGKVQPIVDRINGSKGVEKSRLARQPKWHGPAGEELRKIRAEGRGGSAAAMGREIHGWLQQLEGVEGTPKDPDTVIRWVRTQ